MPLSSDRFTFDGDNVVRRGRKTPVVRIVPDAKYPNMWRVELPDGTLTDMVNRTRAKEAALALASRIENDRKTEAAE